MPEHSLSPWIDVPPQGRRPGPQAAPAPLTGTVVGVVDEARGIVEVRVDGAPDTAATVVAPTEAGVTYMGAPVRVSRDADGAATTIHAPTRPAPDGATPIPVGETGRRIIDATRAADQALTQARADIGQARAQLEEKIKATGGGARVSDRAPTGDDAKGHPVGTIWEQVANGKTVGRWALAENGGWEPVQIGPGQLAQGTVTADTIVASRDLWARLAVFDDATVVGRLTAENAVIPGELIAGTITGKTIVAPTIVGGQVDGLVINGGRFHLSRAERTTGANAYGTVVKPEYWKPGGGSDAAWEAQLGPVTATDDGRFAITLPAHDKKQLVTLSLRLPATEDATVTTLVNRRVRARVSAEYPLTEARVATYPRNGNPEVVYPKVGSWTYWEGSTAPRLERVQIHGDLLVVIYMMFAPTNRPNRVVFDIEDTWEQAFSSELTIARNDAGAAHILFNDTQHGKTALTAEGLYHTAPGATGQGRVDTSWVDLVNPPDLLAWSGKTQVSLPSKTWTRLPLRIPKKVTGSGITIADDRVTVARPGIYRVNVWVCVWSKSWDGAFAVGTVEAGGGQAFPTKTDWGGTYTYFSGAPDDYTTGERTDKVLLSAGDQIGVVVYNGQATDTAVYDYKLSLDFIRPL